jgi:hypothetical protein
MEMKKCESCGMPMTSLSDFGGRKTESRYCKHCSYPDGGLRPRYEVRENMVLYYMKNKRMERPAAEQYVDSIMESNPAWQ